MQHYFGRQMEAVAPVIPMLLIFLLKGVGVLASLGGLFQWKRSGQARLRLSAVGWWLGLIVMVSALLGGPASTPRFRVPVEPLLSIGAAAGLLLLLEANRQRRERRKNLCR